MTKLTMGMGMYLKKVDGPRSVTLADGTVMTQADLPSAKTRRWVASRKAAVVRGVAYGLISQADALKRYEIPYPFRMVFWFCRVLHSVRARMVIVVDMAMWILGQCFQYSRGAHT